MSFIKLIIIAVIGLAIFGSFFSSEDDVNVVNLDTVLDSMIATFEALDGDTAANANTEQTVNGDTPENAGKTALFIETYHEKINEAKMMPDPIGVAMQGDGSVLGFTDADNDNAQSGTETDLFKVEIDVENSRLIATDLQHGYHRDSGFRMGTGLLAGYMLGRMLTSQRAAGISPNRFKNMNMQPRGYHASARSSVRQRVKASRGSRSFSLGK